LYDFRFAIFGYSLDVGGAHSNNLKLMKTPKRIKFGP